MRHPRPLRESDPRSGGNPVTSRAKPKHECTCEWYVDMQDNRPTKHLKRDTHCPIHGDRYVTLPKKAKR